MVVIRFGGVYEGSILNITLVHVLTVVLHAYVVLLILPAPYRHSINLLVLMFRNTVFQVARVSRSETNKRVMMRIRYTYELLARTAQTRYMYRLATSGFAAVLPSLSLTYTDRSRYSLSIISSATKTSPDKLSLTHIKLFSSLSATMSSTSDSQPAAPKFNPAPAFRNTQSPDPSWSLGEGLKTSATQLAREWKEDEKQGWTTLDLGELSKPCVFLHRYRLQCR